MGYKVANVINSSYYAALINNYMATDSPIRSKNATQLIFDKSDVIGVEVYSNIELSTGRAAVLSFPKSEDTTSCLCMCRNLHFHQNNGGLPR